MIWLLLIAIVALGTWWFFFRDVKTAADTQPVKPSTPLADALSDAKLDDLPPPMRQLPHVVKRNRAKVKK